MSEHEGLVARLRRMGETESSIAYLLRLLDLDRNPDDEVDPNHHTPIAQTGDGS